MGLEEFGTRAKHAPCGGGTDLLLLLGVHPLVSSNVPAAASFLFEFVSLRKSVDVWGDHKGVFIDELCC